MTEKIYDKIADVLSRFPLPGQDKTVLELGLVDSISIKNNLIKILLLYKSNLNFEKFASYCESLTQILKKELYPFDVKILFHHSHTLQNATSSKPINYPFANTPILMIGSGKGGVGKSSVASGLCRGLLQQGYRVGFIDADIYGPSLPTLLEEFYPLPEFPLSQFQPLYFENKKLVCTSLGFYTNPQDAAIWRGPMLKKTLDSFIFQLDWPPCDIIIVDLPPGTGDVAISMAHALPTAQSICITTPHKLALADVQRSINMFHKVSIPILGLIVNMTHMNCPSCDHSIPLYHDQSLVEGFAKKHNLSILDHIPFAQNPLVLNDNWVELAQKISTLLTLTKTSSTMKK